MTPPLPPADAAAADAAATVSTVLGHAGLPRPQARELLAHVLGLRATALVAEPERPVAATAVAAFEQLVARQRAGEPLAYLLGHQPFLGRSFVVTPAVLVPRPETEELVLAALERLAPVAAPRVLDLGTGSGCIALSIALARPTATVVGVDASAAALQVAQTNAARLGAAVAWRQGDWYGPLAPTERFDLIVANPPYVRADDPHLDALRHEPRGALVAAGDGLADLAAIVRGAPDRLVPEGWLLVEHGFEQGAAVRALCVEAGLIEVGTCADAAGHERIGVARRSGAQRRL